MTSYPNTLKPNSRDSHSPTVGIDTWNGTFPDTLMSRSRTALDISAVPLPEQKLVADVAW